MVVGRVAGASGKGGAPILAMLTTEGVLSRKSCTVCISSAESSDLVMSGACHRIYHNSISASLTYDCQLTFAPIPTSHRERDHARLPMLTLVHNALVNQLT